MKAALAAELGAEEAAGAYGRMAGWDAEVRTLPLAGLWDFASGHASECERLGGGSEHEVAAVPVFGEQVRPPGRARARQIASFVLRDATVVCKSNLIVAGDRALLDFQGKELRDVPVNLDVDPLVVSAGDGAVTLAVPRPRHRLERALSLAGVHSYNFGHWLIEFLPRLFASLGRAGFAEAPLVVDAQMPPQHFEALRAFAGDAHPIVALEPGESARVERLWTACTPSYVPVGLKPGVTGAGAPRHVMDDRTLAALLEVPAPALRRHDAGRGGGRLYLTRTDEQHRVMANRAEVEDWFAARGFEVHELGSVSFADQLGLVRRADVIAGAAGSSMLLAQYARPGAGVGVLSNEYVEDSRWLAFACRGLGHRLSVLRGANVSEAPDYEMFSDFETPVAALPGFLDGLSASGR